jgi:hypothetical protein
MSFSILEYCPLCGAPYGGRFLGITSGLGSASYICKSCRKPFTSGRIEWTEMDFDRKLWYCLASLAYAAFIGFAGGTICQTMVRCLTEGRQALNRDIEASGGLFWGGVAVLGSIVIAVQSLRIVCSLKRTTGIEKRSLVSSFFSFHTNLQFLAIASISLVLLGGILAFWLIHG